MTACLPDNEVERLVALYEHSLLDSEPTQEFDDLVRLAAHICGVPIAAVTLIDAHRQWFKAIFGLDVRETPRDIAFCAHTILTQDIFVIQDTRDDPRFADNPLVTSAPDIRFYAGVPLITEEGHALGTLCIIDRVPRTLTPMQEETLRLLGCQAAGHLRAARRIAAQRGVVAEGERLLLEREWAERDRLRLSAIVESADEAIIAATLDGTIVAWNRGAERLYGYSAAELIGQHMSVLAPPSEKHLGREVAARLVCGETPEKMEVVRTRKDGVRIDVSLSFSPIRDAAGEVVGGSCVSRDITEQKRIETALAESEARLRRLCDAAFEGIAVSQDGVVVDVNIAFAAMHGSNDPAEMIGLTPQELVAPECRALVQQKISDCDEHPYEAILQRKDGSTFIGELRGRRTQHDGSPARVTAICDITARKEAELALSRSEASLRAVLEIAPIILYATDAAGTVTLSEGTGLASLGLKSGQAVGHSVFDFSADSPENAARTRRALAGEAASWDAQVGDLCLHTDLRPVWGEDDSPNGLIGVCYDVTERMRSEERFRILFEQSSDAHLLLGAGGLIDCNPACVAMFGCADKSEMLSLHPATMSPEFQPDGRLSREKKAEMDALAYQNGFHRFDWVLRRTNGEEFPVEVTLTPVTVAGQPVILSVLHDLTERKRSEQALRVEQEKFQSLVDGLGTGLLMTDLEDTIQYANPRMAEITGYAREELVGQCAFELLLPPAEQERMHRHNQERAAGDSGSYEIVFHRKDGSQRWLEVFAVPFRNAAGEVIGTVATNTDITERVLAETALRESEARLRLALASGRFGTFELDLVTGRCLGASDTYKAQLGLPPDADFSLGTLIGMLHPEDRVCMREIAEPANAAGLGWQAEHRVVWSDGSIHWISVHTMPVLDDSGRPHRAIGILQDITERKALEAERERLAERERTIATQLQAALQPPPELVPGLQIASLTRPALDEAQIGGDFYDVFPLDTGRYALVIGDVSGKGLAAAVQLALIRNSLRTTLYLCPHPAEAATKLNAIVTAHSLLVGFVTAWVGIYDSATGRITYTSCAHEPGLVRRAGGGVDVLETTGPPLGMDQDAVYGELTVTLATGDSLLLHTDGLPESGPSRREMLGTEGMVRLVAEQSVDLDVQQQAEELVAAAAANANGVFRDDVTVLLARRTD
jgi:PAS domain S-box-containing protein